MAALRGRAPLLQPGELVKAADALCNELDPGDARALVERACTRDTASIESEAENYHRAALATGQLDDYRPSRASIQWASTLRVLGHLDESESLLVAELDRHSEPGHLRVLHDEARATLALPCVAQGRAVEAAGWPFLPLPPICSATTDRSRETQRDWSKRPGIDV